MYTYDPLQCFKEKTVKVFQYSLDWLKDRIKEIAGPEWGFVKNNPPIPEPFYVEESEIEAIEPSKDYHIFLKYLQSAGEFYLDTETWNFKDKNPMSNIGLITIQIDNHYLVWEALKDTEKETIINAFVGKTIYLYNLNFDASQLKHAGFRVEENKWFDIALLARLCENRLMDKYVGFPFSFNNLARNILGYSTKEELIEELQKKLKVKSKDKLFSVSGLVYEPKFKEYALNDTYLTQKLHKFWRYHYNYPLWRDVLSLVHFQQWKNGFQGVKLNIKDINKRILDLTKLRREVL